MHTTVRPEYLSINQAAELLGVSPDTIRRRVDAGELPATQLGGPGSTIRIPADALRIWLWSNPQTEER
jgi:excisionase family DNA binding protein